MGIKHLAAIIGGAVVYFCLWWFWLRPLRFRTLEEWRNTDNDMQKARTLWWKFMLFTWGPVILAPWLVAEILTKIKDRRYRKRQNRTTLENGP